jgi:hypothetical protein
MSFPKTVEIARFEPNAVYVLSELEKHIEREKSFIGSKYKTVNDLIAAKKKFKDPDVNERPPHLKREGLGLSSFTTFKVVNRFKVKKVESSNAPADMKFKNEQHGRPQKRYHRIFDAKYIKMIEKRSYRAENLYEFFKNLYQLLNTSLLELESCKFSNGTS